MYVVVPHGRTHFFRQKVIVHKRLCGLRSELHHHSGRRISVHICILTRYVIVFGLDYFKEHIAGLGTACNRTFVAVGDVTFGNVLTCRLHQLHLDLVLNLLHGHPLVACHSDSVRYTLDKRLVLACIGCEHSFPYGRFDFFFIISDDSAVPFDYRLYHIVYYSISYSTNVFQANVVRNCLQKRFKISHKYWHQQTFKHIKTPKVACFGQLLVF